MILLGIPIFFLTKTAVAPGGPAFSIWTLIYLGFLALAIWQALPAHTAPILGNAAPGGGSPRR